MYFIGYCCFFLHIQIETFQKLDLLVSISESNSICFVTARVSAHVKMPASKALHCAVPHHFNSYEAGSSPSSGCSCILMSETLEYNYCTISKQFSLASIRYHPPLSKVSVRHLYIFQPHQATPCVNLCEQFIQSLKALTIKQTTLGNFTIIFQPHQATTPSNASLIRLQNHQNSLIRLRHHVNQAIKRNNISLVSK